MEQLIKPIAIHLPQFHPFKENDEWWGKGFTEWTNVAKAKPLFESHYQPHFPADLGFYDLRLDEARIAQAEMAKQYGIHGFCYYHYWFNGTRLMHQPLDKMLTNKQEKFPFMLCWANENWTRRWDGQEAEVLIKQDYSTQDDIQHIRFLLETFLTDERYIKVEGKPFFTVYRPKHFPNIKATLETWRNEAQKMGLGELYLGYFRGFLDHTPPAEYGFDCGVEFQPDYNFIGHRLTSKRTKFLQKLRFDISKRFDEVHTLYDYAQLADNCIRSQKILKNVYPGISPMWDNSARRKAGASIYINSTPEIYGKWLESIAQKYQQINPVGGEKFVFINAWNEWAEGNHLEPCQKWGTQYLEITREVLRKYT